VEDAGRPNLAPMPDGRRRPQRSCLCLAVCLLRRRRAASLRQAAAPLRRAAAPLRRAAAGGAPASSGRGSAGERAAAGRGRRDVLAAARGAR
jgi:hypothetical protein